MIKNTAILAFGTAVLSAALMVGCIKQQPLPSAPALEHTFGEGKNEVAGGIIALPNAGGFLIVGGSQDLDANDYDLFLVKVKPDGSEEWSRKIGKRSFDEVGWRVLRNSTGEYVILGTTRPAEGGSALMQLTLLDADWNVRWQTTSATTLPNTGLTLQGAAFYEMQDGGYFAGFAGQSYPVGMRFAANGSLVHTEPYSGYLAVKFAQHFCKGPEDGFVMVARGNNSDYDRLEVAQLDSLGQFVQGLGIYGVGFTPEILAVQRLQSGNYVVSLMSESLHHLVFLDSNFVLQRTVVRGSEPFYGRIVETASGNILLAGYDGFNGYDYAVVASNMRVQLCDSLGADLRSRTFGGTGAERLFDAISMTGGGVALLGETLSYGEGGTDLYLTFFDE